MTRFATPSHELTTLATTAVLGTSRAASDATAAAALLNRAAAAALRARAGRRSPARAHPISPCPPDTRPPATPAQAATLDRLLTTPNTLDAALIIEWCHLAQTHSVRVPAEHVPPLLDWWSKQPSRPTEVFAATGSLGSWLATLNPTWHKPVPPSTLPANADELWHTATTPERIALLATVRQADPRRALALIHSTWETDSADDRRKCIAALTATASLDDEPFLESALDDRSKVVRREAARVLTSLPGSALRERMRTRAASMLRVETTKAAITRRAATTVTLEPPKAFDKSWERDALEEQPASGKGKRAFWLAQILASTDLAALSTTTRLTPPDLLAALRDDEYADDALAAMLASLAACPRQPDAAPWCDALIAACPINKLITHELLASVWTAQPTRTSESLRLTFLITHKASRAITPWHLLASDPRPWSLDFSTTALAHLEAIKLKPADTWDLWPPIESISKLLHPAAADAFDRLISTTFRDNPSPSIRTSLDRIRLRAQMHKEFHS